MLGVITCLLGVFTILRLGDDLRSDVRLKPEDRRKFVHILAGCFIAFWPWFISWRAIQILGLLMLAIVVLNRWGNFFKFNSRLRRRTYGDYFFAISVTLCALITTNKVFFAASILMMALADGLAAVAGRNFGKRWKYTVFGQAKTAIGTMTFWFVAVCILDVASLVAHNSIVYGQYYWLILLLPPALTLIENLAVFGLDNLAVPVLTVIILRLAQA